MKNLFTFLFSLAVLFGACQTGNNSDNAESTETGTFERLDVAQFQEKLAVATNPQLIDVRTPEEYAQGTIMDAVNMNFHDDSFEQQLNTLDKAQPVYIFCQAGGRSLKTAKTMQSLGFKEIYELEVGYSGWEQ